MKSKEILKKLQDLKRYSTDEKSSASVSEAIHVLIECCEYLLSCQPDRLNPEGTILPAYYGNKFCAGCKEENCVCDSQNSDNK